MKKQETIDMADGLIEMAKKLYESVNEDYSVRLSYKEYNMPRVRACKEQLIDFMKDCLVHDNKAGQSIGASELYSRYAEWCGRNDMTMYNTTLFGRALPLLGVTKARSNSGSIYLGLKLKTL